MIQDYKNIKYYYNLLYIAIKIMMMNVNDFKRR